MDLSLEDFLPSEEELGEELGEELDEELDEENKKNEEYGNNKDSSLQLTNKMLWQNAVNTVISFSIFEFPPYFGCQSPFFNLVIWMNI